MLENDFRNWLLNNKYGNQGTVSSRMTNCLRVELFEGDLDRHFVTDECGELLKKLTYSTEDEKHNRPPSHNIPINGDMRTGTSTLKSAINLYVDFKKTGMTKGSRIGPGPIKSGILYVIFNTWIRNPKTGEMPYKIITSTSAKDGDYGLVPKIPGKFETLFAYQFGDYVQCEKAEQIIHKLLEKFQENGEWFYIDDNKLALIKLNCEEALGGTLITKENL